MLFSIFQLLWQVTFFQQGTIPCVPKAGKLIMETSYRAYRLSMLKAFKKTLEGGVHLHYCFFCCVRDAVSLSKRAAQISYNLRQQR
nr:udp-n-acetylglucosamine diphosphorylase 2 [Quercus suber]